MLHYGEFPTDLSILKQIIQNFLMVIVSPMPAELLFYQTEYILQYLL